VQRAAPTPAHRRGGLRARGRGFSVGRYIGEKRTGPTSGTLPAPRGCRLLSMWLRCVAADGRRVPPGACARGWAVHPCKWVCVRPTTSPALTACLHTAHRRGARPTWYDALASLTHGAQWRSHGRLPHNAVQCIEGDPFVTDATRTTGHETGPARTFRDWRVRTVQRCPALPCLVGRCYCRCRGADAHAPRPCIRDHGGRVSAT
jgi:hypothetical protein